MAEWIIEPLSTAHDRKVFSCGHWSLDDFIRARVSQYEKRRLGKTYVAVAKDAKRVLGFYTLAAGAVTFQHLPQTVSRRLPMHPVPVVLLARLAVDQSAQRQGLGERLLFDALRRSLDLSRELGIHAVEVDAIDDAAATFYAKYGFARLTDRPRHLFLPMATIQEALG